MTIRDQLILDLENMENGAAMTADRCDIWQDRLIYNICVALVHLLRWTIKEEGKKWRSTKSE